MAKKKMTGKKTEPANLPQETVGVEGTGLGPDRQFVLSRIYIKDVSFESPMGPAVFDKQWQPKMGVDLRTHISPVDDNSHEVTLTVTVTAKLDGETAFLTEIQQAGLFKVQGIEGDELRHLLAVHGPTTLFPYLRETVDSLLLKGSFPPLMLSQMNFEALYLEALKQMEMQQKGEKPPAS